MGFTQKLGCKVPEVRAVVGLGQMRDFVRDDCATDMGGRKHQPPAVGNSGTVWPLCAAAPAASIVAGANRLDRPAKPCGQSAGFGFQQAQGFGLQPAADAASEKFACAGDQQPVPSRLAVRPVPVASFRMPS